MGKLGSPASASASRSDLQALRRSGRGKLVWGTLLFAGALGAAGWTLTREQGHGNPEDPARVLVVSQARIRGYEIALRDAGFDAVERTEEIWTRKAQEELPEDQPREGVAGILALADRYGYGFVAFESPSRLDFGGLGIGGVDAVGPKTEFAVVSVGDLADPATMTVNPPRSAVMRDPSLPLLRALFAQPDLSQLVETERKPSVDDIKLRDRLGDALDTLERLPKAERMADDIARQARALLDDGERGESAPTVLGDPLESMRPLVLSDGSILTAHRRFSIKSSNGVRVELDFEPEDVLMHRLEPGGEPVACDTLAGGTLVRDEAPQIDISTDGSTVLTKTLSEGIVAWRYTPARGRCGFERAGEVPPALPGMDPVGVPGPDGRVARAGVSAGQGAVSVVQAGVDGRVLLGMVEGVNFGAPTWIDAHHLVVRGRPQEGDVGPDSLWFLSTDMPLVALRLDATAFDSGLLIHEVAASAGVGEGAVPVVVATVGRKPRRLYELRLPATLSGMFGTLGKPTLDRRREGLPNVHDLDSNVFSVRPLTHEGTATEPGLSPTGDAVVVSMFADGLDREDENGDREIVHISLDGPRPSLRVLTRNGLDDRRPVLTQGGRWVVFKTRYEVPSTTWATGVARAVATATQDSRPPKGPAAEVPNQDPERVGGAD